MRYFLPDSCDAVDTTFDFERESRSPDRIRRDDLYCHEMLDRPYDGILITVKGKRYSGEARRRLLRSGAREFYRAPAWCSFMGDPGAFSYIKEDEPPLTVTEAAEFYAATRLDLGLAVDHIVEGYSEGTLFDEPAPEQRRRYDLTLALASDFWRAAQPYDFTPVGVVQGWSPASFARAAADLQRMGYRYLALGGLVRLKDDQLLRVLRAVDSVRAPETKLHLLGVTRTGNFAEYIARGVASIDSTSPLVRAWGDKKANFFIGGESYCALRIPSSTSSKVHGRIGSGEINGETARVLEHAALAAVAAYAAGDISLSGALESLLAYQAIHSPGDDRRADYTRTLEAKPWTLCKCRICTRLGHHVILFRGAERNRSRGFHNVGQFYRGMLRELGEPALVLIGCGAAKREGWNPAADLYTGSVYRAHSKLATNYRAPIRILSGLHGVLDPARVIEKYDATVPAAGEERRVWNSMIARQLAEIVEPGSTIVAFAGERYLGWISDAPGITVQLPLAGMTTGKRLEFAAGKPAEGLRPIRTGSPIAWDFFWTTFRSSLRGDEFTEHWDRSGAWTARLELPDDTELPEAIAAAREAGLFGKGTSKTGVFEVQNDRGIYWCPDGFVNLGLARPTRIRFITWNELEFAEERGEDDLHADYAGRLGASLGDIEREAA